MKKLTILAFLAVAAGLLYAIVRIIDGDATQDLEALYQKQIQERGKSGKVKYLPFPTIRDYDEQVREITLRALYSERIKTSWYGPSFHGKCKSNGDFFDMNKPTVAHKTLPLGTFVAISYGERYILAKVTDRGPYVKNDPERKLDISRAIARYLGIEDTGVTHVMVHVLRIPVVEEKYHKQNPPCMA